MDHQAKDTADVSVVRSVCISSKNTYLDNEREFLVSLFQRLSESEILYCVLRNYQSLPLCTDGSDIDILLEPEYEQSFIDILMQVAEDNNAKLLVFYRSGSFVRFCYCNPNYVNGWGIQFDLHTDETYRGLPFIDKQQLLDNCIYHRNIPVLNTNDAMILALLKECLSNLKSRKNYHEKAMNAYTDDSERYDGFFKKYFGKRVAADWNDYLLQRKTNPSLNQISRKSRYTLLLTAMRINPLDSLANKLKYNFDRVTRIIKPIGYSIAILGTDGSGKTTIINNITPLLELALHTTLNYEHMRPNLLPSIATLFGKEQKQGMVTDPHGSKPSGVIGSILRILYYTIDYILGYWFKVYPQMVKKPCLFIFDRYFYDYYIDQRRSRIALPQWVIRFYGLFVPDPDLIICLGTDTDIIRARKPELPLEEVARQVQALKVFSNKKKNAVWIDTGVSINESSDRVLQVITDKMANRYKSKFNNG